MAEPISPTTAPATGKARAASPTCPAGDLSGSRVKNPSASRTSRHHWRGCQPALEAFGLAVWKDFTWSFIARVDTPVARNPYAGAEQPPQGSRAELVRLS